ncbi:alpha/beta fold hydrolase [Sedimenticola selenatireducens]|jgi:pimeloyl-ACP methyl ester carboxylesterase|uniref:Alpha/beta hydrolase n=1 Tax=Sedimenticola selenatireducens TaxID=191960 RepID=A0A558DZG2_9GAMM|nr:alpha/beta hydrolase [Sedimenticola selenatireducens]TVO71899.1 alpha/beta hydrolase [Sedimenticola selenatireducens]TVT66279.1 MAG: alpha/beta hydrolase [Sedimenticola selenatireducens]
MAECFVMTNGIRLHYLDYQGTGPTLLLMPGLTANAHSFDGLVAEGVAAAVRLLAVDLRGRGLSDKPAIGYTLAEHAADILGLLDQLGLDQVILGGHSYGGLLGMYMAHRYPERVEKLVVIDAAAEMHPDTRRLIQPAIDRLGKPVSSWETYLAAVKVMPFFYHWWDPTIESYFRADVETRPDGTVISRSKPEAIVEAVEHVLAEAWQDKLSQITQPTLLLNATGAYGLPGAPPLLPREQAIATVEKLSKGRYAEVAGNHITMLYGQGAKQIVKEIIKFVAD